MGQYLPVVVLIVLALAFVGLIKLVSVLFAPKRPTAAKLAPYECGIVPTKDNPERFPVSFYLVAMLFIMFDIEIIFLYPYAVAHQALGMYGLLAMVLFSAVFFLSFVYEVARGGLDWGPVARQRRQAAAVSPARTASSTIRRVGTEGRGEEVAA